MTNPWFALQCRTLVRVAVIMQGKRINSVWTIRFENSFLVYMDKSMWTPDPHTYISLLDSPFQNSNKKDQLFFIDLSAVCKKIQSYFSPTSPLLAMQALILVPSYITDIWQLQLGTIYSHSLLLKACLRDQLLVLFLS